MSLPCEPSAAVVAVVTLSSQLRRTSQVAAPFGLVIPHVVVDRFVADRENALPPETRGAPEIERGSDPDRVRNQNTE